MNALTKSAAFCSEPISVVSLDVFRKKFKLKFDYDFKLKNKINLHTFSSMFLVFKLNRI